ncbi:hypothetical protein JCM15519_21600 [Fundidesulfovibrio butyratiphilus]
MAVIQEAWIGGISTRRVDDLVQAMGLSGISKSQVSKLCKDIDERVHAFLCRPLTGEWPYLWLDATYLKQREGGRVVSVADIIAVATNTEGRREIVGLHIGPSEAEPFWSFFLKGLLRRGLSGVKLVISDAHEGLKAAIAKTFGATWQRCRVHWMRNALARVPKSQHAMVSAALRQAFLQSDAASASQTWRHVADQLRGKWPKLASFMDETEHDVLADCHLKQVGIYTTLTDVTSKNAVSRVFPTPGATPIAPPLHLRHRLFRKLASVPLESVGSGSVRSQSNLEPVQRHHRYGGQHAKDPIGAIQFGGTGRTRSRRRTEPNHAAGNWRAKFDKAEGNLDFTASPRVDVNGKT